VIQIRIYTGEEEGLFAKAAKEDEEGGGV